jgi:hypothetical protein
VDQAELDRRVRRILAIRQELAALYKQTHPGVSVASIGIWIVSGGLGLAGVALAYPTGGSSLLLSVLGMVIFMIDLARQVQSAADSEELRRHAAQLEQELRDHLEFIRRFGASS